MPYNGSGVFSPPGADFPAVAGTLIQATKFNNVINDIASGLSTAITKDGQTTVTANLPMAGFRHTGVGNASARDQYATADQVQDGDFLYGGTAGGTADALTITTSPTFSAYVTGMQLLFKAGASPNTGAATLQANGIAGPKAIQKDGAALAAGDIGASKWYRVTYDGTAFQLEPVSTAAAILLTGTNAWTGINTFVDTNFRVIGSGDATKIGRIEVDGLTTGQTRIGTWLDYDFRFMSQTKGADVASAATLNLDTATGDLVDVTGTTTITAITLAEGKTATVRFTGALTLTNGASLVLPGAANITTAAGDFAIFRGYAAGAVRCVSYVKADGTPVVNANGTTITLGTEQATTSGTSIDFTSIPSWVRRITIMLEGVSTNGTSNPIIQIGDSGGVETSGYTSGAWDSGPATTNSTAGFLITPTTTTGSTLSGTIVLSLKDAANNTWVGFGANFRLTTNMTFMAGDKSLSATLDRVRLTTSNGTDTFDAGSVNISYE